MQQTNKQKKRGKWSIMFELQVGKEQYNTGHVLVSRNLLPTPLGVRTSSSLLAYRFTIYLF